MRCGISGWICEGRKYKPHICTDDLHMNEVIYPRNVFQKLPASKQRYFWHKFNCSVQCSTFHTKWGHTTEYREWHIKEVVIPIYGLEALREWNQNAPLKVKKLV